MAKRKRGFYNKFEVSRTDGTDRPGGKHHGCKYFVLDLTHDRHALAAIDAYADSCSSENRQLAVDLHAYAANKRQRNSELPRSCDNM